MSFFDVMLYASLAVCLVGLVWRAAGWFKAKPRHTARPEGRRRPAPPWGLAKTFILDVLLLRRTARKSLYRWLVHGLILAGFAYLLLFHALSGLISANLVEEYWPTLEPWQFLRNLAGFMVLGGLALALARRLRSPMLKKLSRKQDWLLLALVGSIMISGFLLEAQKIVSPSVFNRMAAEYLGSDDPAEIKALKAYWARDFGGVFPGDLPDAAEDLEMGRSLAEDSCLGCHARLESAFVSLSLSRLLAPLAPLLDRWAADRIFHYLHFSLCLLGLAALPWGKLLHPISTPANLLLRGGSLQSRAGQYDASPRRPGPGLDACTRCGECSLHCSVVPAYRVLDNPQILPSEKLLGLRRHQKDSLSVAEAARFAQGSRICTECLRCTQICPSGIDLQALWAQSKPRLPSPGQSHSPKKRRPMGPNIQRFGGRSRILA